MKKLIVILSVCLLAVSCVFSVGGGGNVIVTGGCTEDGIDYTDVREVAAFRAINSHVPCNVYYTQSDTQEVRVETTEEFAGRVLTEVEEGTLDIRLQDGTYHHLILRVMVSSPEIESLKVSGSGNLYQEGALRVSGNLDIRTSGSGFIRTGEIVCAEFTGKSSGSGGIQAESITCQSLSIASSGSGHIGVDALSAEGDVSAHVSGSGGIYFDEAVVGGDMELRTSGSGSIRVDGKCRNVTATTSGSGSISGDLAYESLQRKESGSGRVSF